jgi:Domain of unknown function (DUF5615)
MRISRTCSENSTMRSFACTTSPARSHRSGCPRIAHEHDCLLMTCNRDDFVKLAETEPHRGIIVVIRRKTRAQERAALVRLLERAGETGLRDNINFT